MKIDRFRLFALTLFLFVQIHPLFSQDIRFNRVALPDENINGTLNSMTQDPKGYIWGCTFGGGLFRYDGVNFKTYMHDPLNPSSIANNNAEYLYQDQSGYIWVGTFGSGLEKFDPETGTFTHYKHSEKDPSSISGDTVNCILQDRDGFIWVGTNTKGLDRLDPKTGKFTHYRHIAKDPYSLSYDHIRYLYEDKKGVLWIGTGSAFKADQTDKSGGLNRFEKVSGKFTVYLHNPKDPQTLMDNRVRSIFEDSRGNFWIGTAGDGLHTMDREKGTFERHLYDPAHPEKLSRPPLGKFLDYVDDHITFITEDIKGAIWVGTLQAGLMRYDPASRKIKQYKSQKEGAGNFSDSSAWRIFTSRDGVMWMSIFGGLGLYRFDPTHQNIAHKELPKKTKINAFLEESVDIQYFGTDSGLFRVNKKNNQTELLAIDPIKLGSRINIPIWTLYKDRKNRIWAGTETGLRLLNPDKQSFTAYKHDAKNSNSLGFDVVFSFLEDKQSNFWLGTVNGLDKMDVVKGTFTHYKAFPEDTIIGGKNFTPTIMEDSRQNLWIGNYNQGGVHILDRKTGGFRNYLKNRSILKIVEDGYGKIWAGAEDGLYYYNSGVDSFTFFNDPSTGLNIVTHEMLEDNNKNLWIVSTNSIYRINTGLNEVSKFGKEFGIIGNSLNYKSAYKNAEGELFFGTTTGYYSLHPDKISSNLIPPEIVLTGFRIGDQQVKPGNGNALEEDLLVAKKIKLGYNQDVFSFLFNVVHFSNPDANRAMFMLENYEQNWRPAGSERSAYYYNIPPGKYKFRIKAASSNGVWAEKSIDIIITPPWWRSWWAYTLYGLILLGMAYSIHHTLKQRVIVAERERTRVRELAQAKEIEKAYHELKTTQTQLIQSEKMASLGELTAGIAHEIQNPLNFINNFSEVNKELLAEMNDEIEQQHYDAVKALAKDVIENQEKINHHGKRADAIVKGMLQHSQSSIGVKEPTDINALADEYLRLAYHGLRAKDKSFSATFKTDFDKSFGKTNIIPQDIGRVLLNLYNNAFYAVAEKHKLSGDGYEPTVTVQTKKINGEVEISVSDNGNGIPEKVMDKVFQPFFTTKPTGQGTGLGLSLSYDIIKAHQGKINIKNSPGEGAEFIITLPV